MITETRILWKNDREIVLPYHAKLKEGMKLYVNDRGESTEMSCREQSHHITIEGDRPIKHTVVVFAE